MKLIIFKVQLKKAIQQSYKIILDRIMTHSQGFSSHWTLFHFMEYKNQLTFAVVKKVKFYNFNTITAACQHPYKADTGRFGY